MNLSRGGALRIKNMIDVEMLKNALEYFPETGVLVWKISPARNTTAGSVAGGINGQGYRIIKHHGRSYPAHRIAWLLMTGDWPVAEIDHRNLDKADNRWSNLRPATKSQNVGNTKGRNKFLKGVSRHRRKFKAQIRKKGKLHYLGLFITPEEANAAYAVAAKKYFGEYARNN